MKRKTMFEVLDEMADKELKQLQKEERDDANQKL